jgi:bis(5'-nucleosyl)-tetraphosphatase (symmetrical)
MAVYAIGDIQGCYDALRRLLDALDFDEMKDGLWFTGDLVNRGPQSLDVLRFVKSLGSSAVSVLGNHDLHLLAVAHDPRARLRRGDTLDDVLAAHDRDELLDWLARRPLLHEDHIMHLTMVHAGLPPQWDLTTARRCADEVTRALIDSPRDFFAAMYGDTPDQWKADLSDDDRRRFAVNCLTRLRVCTGEGRLLLKFKGPLGELPAGAFPWFRVPDRRSRGQRIVFGHWSALGYHSGDDTVSLDTGCVWGGHLTALRLDRDASPVQVCCSGSANVGRPESYSQE